MPQLKIGTAGWDYTDWEGPFYPKGISKIERLPYYAKYFDIVEINSTFYNIPSQEIVRGWLKRTPEGFHFVVKMWQALTHEPMDYDEMERNYSQFFYTTQPLSRKISYILIQFPPWFDYSEKHLNHLKFLLKIISKEYKHVIELRNDSWFESNTLQDLIDGENLILGTTYMPKISPHYWPNQKSYYIRLIGDRELTKFNTIQRPQNDALAHLTSTLSALNKDSKIKEIFIIVNNHFQGFAPESANVLKRTFGVSVHEFSSQKKLTDYF